MIFIQKQTKASEDVMEENPYLLLVGVELAQPR